MNLEIKISRHANGTTPRAVVQVLDPNGEFAAIFIKHSSRAPWIFYVKGKAFTAPKLKAAFVQWRILK
jgi:hypothetical protein